MVFESTLIVKGEVRGPQKSSRRGKNEAAHLLLLCVCVLITQPILTESGPSYKAARVKAAESGYQHYVALFGVPAPRKRHEPSKKIDR